MVFKHFDWVPASKNEALCTSWHFFLNGPIKVVLMFCTFAKINKWRKIALIQSQKI